MGKKRTDWIDIYKGLGILLMVTGHATGRFNTIIYQFHMAAFFVIAGVTFNYKKETLVILEKKVKALLFPYWMAFLLSLMLVWVFIHTGLWKFLFESDFVGFQVCIREFFKKGDIYISWLGASWFLVVLFGIYMLQTVLCKLKTSNILYFATSLLLFLFGYYLAGNKIESYYFNLPWDLILVGQFYFTVGVIAKESDVYELLVQKKSYMGISLVFSCTALFLLRGFGNIIDFPSRRIGNPLYNIVGAVSGSLLLTVLSIFLSDYTQRLKKGLCYIGKNTLGIMLWHFLGFKLSYCLLHVLGITDASFITNFTPTAEIGRQYWWLIGAVSIIFSLIVWKYSGFQYIMNLPFSIANWINKTRFTTYVKTVCEKLRKRECRHFVYFLLLFTGSTTITLIRSGIICNDELQTRLLRQQGIGHFIQENFKIALENGRVLGGLVETRLLGFVSNSRYLYRAVDVFLILLSFTLFGVLMYLLSKNKNFACFTSVLLTLFLPVTFEHTVPNAFVGLLAGPAILLILSLIIYILYLKTGKKYLLLASMALYILSMMQYEFIVTYCLLFGILSCWEHYQRERRLDIRKAVRKMLIPLCCTLVYIAVYFSIQIFFPSNYAGNEIGFVSISSSLKIILTLAKSSLPGYFLFNTKYQWLSQAYNGSLTLENVMVLRILLCGASLVFILKRLATGSNGKRLFLPCFSGVCLLYMTAPSLPNSIAKLYQGGVNESSFTALPVTFFLYFASVALVSAILWNLLCRLKVNGQAVVILIVLFLGLNVQVMNEGLSKEQLKNYNNLVFIERAINSSVFDSLRGKDIYSQDIFKTQNLLAIHDSYWTEYALTRGMALNLLNAEGNQEQIQLLSDDYQYIVLRYKDKLAVVSDVMLSGPHCIKTGTDSFSILYFDDSFTENGLYLYLFKSNGPAYESVEYNETDPLDAKLADVGSTFSQVVINNGIYADGWAEKKSSFYIKTLEVGTLYLKILVPQQNQKDFYINVAIEDMSGHLEEAQVTSDGMNQGIIDVKLDVPINTVIECSLTASGEFSASPPDERMLSYIIQDIYTR